MNRLLLASVLTCSALSLAAAPLEPAPKRVLFIGNSLTAGNDLAAMFCRMAEETGRALTCASETRPNTSIDDHWRRGNARRRLTSERWDLVVLQQGPSTLPDSREMLVAWTQEWAKEIRRRGGKPALLMVWPSADRPGDFEKVASSYRTAAQKSNALLIPAGEVWRSLLGSGAALLYAEDRFHPAPAGTYAAALAAWSSVFGGIPEALRDPATAERIAGVAIGEEFLRAMVAAAQAQAEAHATR